MWITLRVFFSASSAMSTEFSVTETVAKFVRNHVSQVMRMESICER
jgi:hypothetical protein